MTYATPPASLHAILRLPDVVRETGLSRSTVWQHSKHGLLPRPVKLTARNVGWPAAEIAAVNAARIAGSDNDGIRALIGSLHGQRQHAATVAQTVPPTVAESDDETTDTKVTAIRSPRRKGKRP